MIKVDKIGPIIEGKLNISRCFHEIACNKITKNNIHSWREINPMGF